MKMSSHVKQPYLLGRGRFLSVSVSALAMAILACSSLTSTQTQPQASEVAPALGGDGACSLFDSIPAAAKYDAAPPQLIDVSVGYLATVKMAKGGEFVIELYPDKAPITVNSFVFLACKGFFNGVTYHRVLEGFMAQGGDPTGTGMGGPGAVSSSLLLRRWHA